LSFAAYEIESPADKRIFVFLNRRVKDVCGDRMFVALSAWFFISQAACWSRSECWQGRAPSRGTRSAFPLECEMRG
jgi:hypothetical protein